MAGLWERWEDLFTHEELLSATIILGPASKWMRAYHDRMPVLLDPKDFDAWHDGSAGLEMLTPAPQNVLRKWIVSKRVNKTGVGDDDPAIIAKKRAALGRLPAGDLGIMAIDLTGRRAMWLDVR